MKCLIFLLVPLLFFASPTFAQENPEADTGEVVYEEENETVDYRRQNPFRILDSADMNLGIYGTTMPFFRQQSFGGGLDFQIGYTSIFSAGISLAMTGRKVDPKFGYNIGASKLIYYELNLYNEIKLLQWKRLSLSHRLNTGYAAFHLSDNSIKEKYWWYDEYGNAYEGERALPIATNKFFKVAPALYLRYQISYYVSVEAGAAYNFYIGDTQYGRRADFNNYMLQAGLKFDIN